MKKEKQELKVIVHGDIDLKKMPKDLFDAFIAVLTDEVEKLIEEDRLKAAEEGQQKIEKDNK